MYDNSKDRVTESADCLDSNCALEENIQNEATTCTKSNWFQTKMTLKRSKNCRCELQWNVRAKAFKTVREM